MEYCNGAGSDPVLAAERSAGSGGRTRRLIANLALTTMRGPAMLSHAFSRLTGSTCRSPAVVRRRGAPWIAARRRRTSRYGHARSQRLRSGPPYPLAGSRGLFFYPYMSVLHRTPSATCAATTCSSRT
jgi:hypothetical protein